MWLASVLSYIQRALADVFLQVTWSASICSGVCLKEPGAARTVLEWLRQRSLQSTTDLSWPCTSYLFCISLFAFFFFVRSSCPSPPPFFFFNGMPSGFLFQLFDKELTAYRWRLSKKGVPQMMSSYTCQWVLSIIVCTLCLLSSIVTWGSPRLQRELRIGSGWERIIFIFFNPMSYLF